MSEACNTDASVKHVKPCRVHTWSRCRREGSATGRLANGLKTSWGSGTAVPAFRIVGSSRELPELKADAQERSAVKVVELADALEGALHQGGSVDTLQIVSPSKKL